MKKRWIFAAIGLLGLASLAATCRIASVSLTEIDGEMHYGAEMMNGTDADILNHRFKVAFLDRNNAVVTVVTVEGCVRSLQSGASDYYSADSNRSSSSVRNAISRIEGPLTFGKVANGDIAISNLAVVRDGESLVVTGRLTNDDNDTMEDSRVCIVVLNGDHEVVLAQRDNNQFDLDDGETADFSVTLVVPDDTDDVSHVRVLVDAINADEDDRPTQPQVVAKVDASTATHTPTAAPTNTSTATPTPTQTSTSTPTATNTP